MISPRVEVTKSSQETFDLGVAMAKTLKGGEVIALHGDLGSGKTVFAQGVGYGLGITQKITSPTFLIIKQYPVQNHQVTMMYHADLYRTGDIREIREIGLLDMMSEQNCVTVIEWPEKMAELLPEKTIHKTFLYDGEDNRLVVDGTHSRYIKQAVEVLKVGGIVIFPTDTAFGIGCRVDSQASVKKLFELGQRPLTKATPVLFDSIDQVSSYVNEISKDVREDLMGKYWPGALTIVLDAQTKKVNSLVLGGGTTIAARIPGNEVIQSIIKGVGVPIIGTSANFNGKLTPYRYGDLDPRLCELVDYVVPGVCELKKESTVIDCTGKPWKVLRQGAIVVSIND
jgi:tRNA threonylcarbamoyl adenosine modification protein (Sua5/YciO/YrdC/YwlC family)/tRNA threonylcarbamoyl adenosine modification protein YjeE